MPKMTVYKISDAGKRMRDVILERNLKVTEIAKETHIARYTLAEFIYHGRNISSEKLRRLCIAVGVSADYILDIESVEKCL